MIKKLKWNEFIQLAKEELGYNNNQWIKDWNEVVEKAKDLQNNYNQRMKQKYEAYLKTDKWQFVRSKVLERNPLCKNCEDYLDEPPNPSTECHHIHYKYFGRGDINEIDSCIGVCHECHEILTEIQKEEYEDSYEKALRER